MLQKFTEFFQQYADAMQNRQLRLLKSIYRLPFIVVHDELKSVVSFENELDSEINKILGYLEQLAVTNVEVKVKKSIALSNNIHFVNVDWFFKNAKEQVQLSYNSSYMLSVVEDSIKIITVIIDDANDTYLQLID